ncbi:polyphenol oxidase family protein [Egicoccus sp. AB-alg2]|uniref:polyphenol oxidase family protein n=1 Tax=Egicoccus sp. AB-alg2 TaxID=3242693 RepID=UPI00359EA26B
MIELTHTRDVNVLAAAELRGRSRSDGQTVAFDARFADERVMAAFTSSAGGVSDGPYATLNLSFQTGDDPDRVADNRRRAAESLGYDPSRLVVAQLAHGPNVEVIGEDRIGAGAHDYESGIATTDALVTNLRGVPLSVLVADCAPVLLYDRARQAVGVSHAGWRGARDRVAAATVQAMVEKYGTDPTELQVAVGPCISLPSFEMGTKEAAECAAEFGDNVVSWAYGPKPHVDLRAMVTAQLLEVGVPPEQIELLSDDTMTSPTFFSHRASMAATGQTGGRFAGMVMVR